uniref:Response regulator with CheY-like receiver, AAA-type ATPase, and DNA-binding domains n=1 Tax=Desulfovibrio sp. U5L TaxID=596152 RepID=I2Q012_9BACT
MDFYNHILSNGIDEHLARFLFPNILGNSPQFLEFLKRIYLASQNADHILLEGETGTGKTYYANNIWQLSKRKDQQLVTLDCSEIHRDITLSVLQGHIRGSFTGAYNDKIGKIEESNKGILLIENIENLNPEGQSALVRFIDESSICRLGDNFKREIDSKLIITASKNIKNLAQDGKLDEKLYYRLTPLRLTVPTLRSLDNDLYFIAKRYCNDYLNINITKKALVQIESYPWPGNFRELFTCLDELSKNNSEEIGHRAIIEYLGQTSIGINEDIKLDTFHFENFNLDIYLENIERKIIGDALEQTEGIQSKAAKLLGIKERSLWHRIKKLDIAVDKHLT